jgi:translation initiation factor RLI1
MKIFFREPDVTMYPGVVVDKDTKLEYKTETITQTIENLTLHNLVEKTGENYETVIKATVHLNDGDVLLFDEERGYYKPVEHLVTIDEAVEELTAMKEVMPRDDT